MLPLRLSVSDAILRLPFKEPSLTFTAAWLLEGPKTGAQPSPRLQPFQDTALAAEVVEKLEDNSR